MTDYKDIIQRSNNSLSGFYTIAEDQITILLVDDDPICLQILEQHVDELGYKWVSAENYNDALNILKENKNIVLALFDINLPDSSGNDIFYAIKSDEYISNIFVVTQTADVSYETRNKAINAGVFYHLTKPFTEQQIYNVVKSAIEQYYEKRKLFSNILSDGYQYDIDVTKCSANEIACKYTFRTLEDVEEISQTIAKIYPDREKVIIGIHELLTNAIEHGNLGIDFEEKSDLIINNEWKNEIDKRLKEEPYCNRTAYAECRIDSDGILLTIKDMGKGFDYQKYTSLDMSGISMPNGRGIAIAMISSFDKLIYSDGGSKVDCYYNFIDQS